jgi:hypothetical protein
VDGGTPGEWLWRRRPGTSPESGRGFAQLATTPVGARSGEKGTAPVGGTTGAVDAPSSGGEELVRRLARPQGGASTAMVAPQPFDRNSVSRVSADLSGGREHGHPSTPSKTDKCVHRRRAPGHPTRRREMAPRGRGAIDRESTRVTRRAHSYVASGQARHDRSISGLPARGCPAGSRWSSDSRQSTRHLPTPAAGET